MTRPGSSMAGRTMRRRRIVPLAAMLLPGLFTGPAAASERIDLDRGWTFWQAADRAATTPEPAWLAGDPAGARAVDVPHSFNLDRGADVDGVGWYARTLVLPAALTGRHLELHFDAVFYRARVWVNGVAVGGHEGGHTGFDIDIGTVARAGENRIVVAADNRPGFATIPGYAMRLKASGNIWYDWWRNGGITRDVSLRIAENGLIRAQAIRQRVEPARATATARVTIENVGARAQAYRLRAVAIAPDGRQAAAAETRVTVAAGASAAPELALTVARPRLWNIGAAMLYRVRTELRADDGRLVDSAEDSIGFRTIAIRDRRLYVNGTAVRLTGMSRHQDSPWEGAAETRGTILHDYRDLDALHVTLTRPVHYPQPQAVLDAADRAGMLLIPEIPIWQMSAAQLADPRLLATAKTMMAEMIAEGRNHPSVLAWSILNESDSSSPAGAAFVTAMKAHIRGIDPDHYVTFADSDIAVNPKRTDALAAADFVMANAYFGTWSGAAAGVGPWLDTYDRNFPDRMLVISEFGWPGPFSSGPAAADAARAANLTEQLDAFAARPFVGGAIFWTYQDYRSNKNLFAGLADGYVDHGLVDADRQRRPSYAAWETRNRAVTAEMAWTMDRDMPAGFTATLRAAGAGALPAHPLIGYRVRWRAMGGDRVLLGEGETAVPDLMPGATATIGGGWTGRLAPVTIDLRIVTPSGAIAATATRDYRPFKAGSAVYPGDPAELEKGRDAR